MFKLIKKLLAFSPLLVIIVIPILIALTNINWDSYYAGWDNILATFDLGRYARQVFFGAWLEHYGLGAPAGLSHLSEITRLPIVFLLSFLLPDNLVRYFFIFIYYLIGGLGMYLFLTKFWFAKNKNHNYLASIGATLYLLHVLTLQQFHISFELFIVQFAWLPFLLISIHLLAKKINNKNIFIFFIIQLLIAPSGHTATLFYLGGIFSVFYAFSLKINKNFLRSLSFAIFIGLFTFFANMYWIVPNFYYSFHNSHYVQESRENYIFGPESIYSIKEASTWDNFLRGTHYLLSWKDYNFQTQQFDYIFENWNSYFAHPLIDSLLKIIGLITILGFILLLFDKKKKEKRFSIIITYLLITSLIWIDLFPTKYLINLLYNFPSFAEAFRNPFTKLSIIYSFISVIFFAESFNKLFNLTSKIKKVNMNKVITSSTYLIAIAMVIVTALPSFQGQFISDKLEVKFPDQYQEMFTYLKQQDKNNRVLQLPQLSHAGWEYYDWQFMELGNGYQGMGFYFFGFPQAFLNRDADRWVETSDFFYHQLKYALDSKNPEKLKNILDQYRVDIVIVDESKIQPAIAHDYQIDHQLVTEAGFEKTWQKDFLTIYKNPNISNDSELIIPSQLTPVYGNTDRVRKDVIYQNQGDYFYDNTEQTIIYPFSDLYKTEITNIDMADNQIAISKDVENNQYILKIPPQVNTENYYTPVYIQLDGQQLSITFPKIQLETVEHQIELTKILDQQFELENSPDQIMLFFNDLGIIVDQNTPATPTLKIKTDTDLMITYTENVEQINNQDTIYENDLDIKKLSDLNVDWQELKSENLLNANVSNIDIKIEFPALRLDINQNESENCSTPKQGDINTKKYDNGYFYQADNYGVNCNGLSFDYISPAYSNIVKIVGDGIQGRGTKFFTNYADSSILAEDYLLTNGKFEKNISLPQVSTNPRDIIYLNWETRSFGGTSLNYLENFRLVPFPIDLISQIQLYKIDNQSTKIENNLTVANHKVIYDSIYIIDYKCQSDNCFIGIDQSYDDLWLAFEKNKLLDHLRLNNWANLWKISDKSGTIYIVYLPELISIASMIAILSAFSTIFVLFIKSKK